MVNKPHLTDASRKSASTQNNYWLRSSFTVSVHAGVQCWVGYLLACINQSELNISIQEIDIEMLDLLFDIDLFFKENLTKT